MRARSRGEQELDLGRGARRRSVVRVEDDGCVGLGTGGNPGRRQAQVAGTPRVRLSRQPDLEPAERRVPIGNLDRDRQPPLKEVQSWPGTLRSRATAAPTTISDRPPEKNGF